MNNNKRVLSTKKLTQSQSELLIATGVGIVHYDILKISAFPVNLKKAALDHVIVTSSNTLQTLVKYKSKVQQVYVVGEKTAIQLKKLGFKIQETQDNAAELAAVLIHKYAHLHFTYLSGVHRRDELPDALLSTQISFEEVKVYDSVMVEKSFDCIFDAVMFYSPRGVHAFAKANPQNIHLAICIGETTATAARIYTDNVKVARKTTVENTIVTAVKALLND